MKTIKKVAYELFSEGKVLTNQNDGSEFYCGEFIINEVELTFNDVEEDEDIELDEFDDNQTIEGFVDAIVVEDKWGDCRWIDGIDYDEYELEFTNGVVSYGLFNTLEEAQKEMNNHINGVVDVKELDFE